MTLAWSVICGTRVVVVDGDGERGRGVPRSPVRKWRSPCSRTILGVTPVTEVIAFTFEPMFCGSVSITVTPWALSGPLSVTVTVTSMCRRHRLSSRATW